MNINKILKIAAIGGSLYAISNACFQYGKGYMLRKMKEYELTVNEALDIVKRDAIKESLSKRINNKIIEISAASKW